MRSDMHLVVGLALALGASTAATTTAAGTGAAGAVGVSPLGDPGHAQGPGQRPYESYVADLSSTDPDVRAGAMRVLASSGYLEALVPLSALLTDPVDDLQLETIDQVLGFFAVDRPPSKRMVGGIVEVRSKAGSAQALFDQGPFVILPRRTPPELVAGLAGAARDQNPRVRLEGIYALGVVGQPPIDPVAAGALVGGLRDTQTEIRVAAARVLGGLRVSQAGEALIDAVNDPEHVVRAAAMRALGDIREPRAVQALAEQFQYYERGTLADAAFDGLARIGSPASIPLFTEQLASRNQLRRRLAAEGLARCGEPQAAAGVATALSDEKKTEVRLARAFAAEAAGQQGLDALVDALASEKTEAQAMAYLVELGTPIAPRLGPSLRHPDARIRERVAMTLGMIGGDQVVAALEPLRRDADTNVARAAERAIARIRIRGE